MNKTCETKKRFGSELAAAEFIKRFEVSNGRRATVKRRPYKCTSCAYWHITSKPLERRAT